MGTVLMKSLLQAWLCLLLTCSIKASTLPDIRGYLFPAPTYRTNGTIHWPAFPGQINYYAIYSSKCITGPWTPDGTTTNTFYSMWNVSSKWDLPVNESMKFYRIYAVDVFGCVSE